MREVRRSLSVRPGLVWLPLVLLSLGVLAVYWQARHGQWLLWDDDINLRDTPQLRALTLEHLRWMFTDTAHMRRYVPFTWLNWALEHAWFGLTPQSTHLGNILLHAFNTLLVFALIRRVLLLRRPPSAAADPETWLGVAAALGAALWALHPLRVEPVAWASGRIYCLTAFLLLLSTLAYLQAGTTPRRTTRRLLLLAASLAAYLASLLTYPLGLSFVGVLLVLDVMVLRRFSSNPPAGDRRRLWAEKAAFATLAMAVGAVTVWAAAHAGGRWEPPVSLAQFGLGPRLSQAAYLWGYYAWRPLFPFDLSPVYTTLVDFRPGAWPFVASTLLVLLVTAVLIWRRRQNPGLFALWLCHLCLLVPVLGLTEKPHYPSDRYGYLAGIPWSLGAAALLLHLGTTPARRRMMGAGTAAIIAVLALLTMRQIPVWHDTESLFRFAIARLGDDPYRADLHRRLGNHYADQGRRDVAEQEFITALQINPREVFAHFWLGRMQELSGRLPAAVESYRRAVQLKPDLAEGYARLGAVLQQAGRLPEALTAYQTRLRLQPTDAAAHTDVAAVLLRLGRPAEALPPVEQAVRLRPDDPIQHLNLGTTFAHLGRTSEAIAAFQAALRLQPDSVAAHLALGRILEKSGRSEAAAPHFRAALARQPDLTEAREALRRLSP